MTEAASPVVVESGPRATPWLDVFSISCTPWVAGSSVTRETTILGTSPLHLGLHVGGKDGVMKARVDRQCSARTHGWRVLYREMTGMALVSAVIARAKDNMTGWLYDAVESKEASASLSFVNATNL